MTILKQFAVGAAIGFVLAAAAVTYAWYREEH
jgi:hypothetical protein